MAEVTESQSARTITEFIGRLSIASAECEMQAKATRDIVFREACAYTSNILMVLVDDLKREGYGRCS